MPFSYCWNIKKHNLTWLMYVESQRSSMVQYDCQEVLIKYVYPSMFSICSLIEADALHFGRSAGCKDLSGV